MNKKARYIHALFEILQTQRTTQIIITWEVDCFFHSKETKIFTVNFGIIKLKVSLNFMACIQAKETKK
jgi:hypothetical protein